MKLSPAISVIIILGLSSLPLSSVHAQWFERMRAMSPRMWSVRPTGFGLPQTLKNVKPVCKPEPKAVGESSGQSAERRRRFINCLLHNHEKELNKMHVMVEKLESRSTKLESLGKNVAPIEAKISAMTKALTEAKAEMSKIQSEIKAMDLTQEAPELKVELKEHMAEILNVMKNVHQVNGDAVAEIRKSTIEQIQGRSDGRFKKPVTE